MSETKKRKKVPHNDEMGFLYKSTTIRPVVISQIGNIPEFMDALRCFDGHLGNKEVYEILKSTYLKMLDEGRGYRVAKDTMNKVSKDVTGDSQTWRNNFL